MKVFCSFNLNRFSLCFAPIEFNSLHYIYCDHSPLDVGFFLPLRAVVQMKYAYGLVSVCFFGGSNNPMRDRSFKIIPNSLINISRSSNKCNYIMISNVILKNNTRTDIIAIYCVSDHCFHTKVKRLYAQL